MTTFFPLFIYNIIIIIIMCLVSAGLISTTGGGSTDTDCSGGNGIGYSVAGITRLFLANYEFIYQYYFDVSDALFTTVNNLSVSPGIEWYEYTVETTQDTFSETESISDSGREYIKTFDATFFGLSPQKRDRLFELMTAKTTLVFKDGNSNWIIMGEDNPCKITKYVAKTDNKDGTSDYKVTFTTTSKTPVRFIDSTYVGLNITHELLPPPNCDCITLVTDDLIVSADCYLLPFANCALQ